MNFETSTASQPAVAPFPSLTALRGAHAELLRRYRSGAASEILSEVVAFIERGRATGALLDRDSDRWAVQSILDYWVTALDRAGHEALDSTIAEFDIELAPELKDELCPYVGLDAFQADQEALFFGRGRLVTQLVEVLKSHRLVSVLGSSGSGKSSLVLAGLLPMVRDNRLPGSENWRCYPRLVPGSHPLNNMARIARPSDDSDAEWDRAQVERFRKDSSHLLNLISEAGAGPALLIIDQFEELFTLCNDEEDRKAFAENIVRLVEHPQSEHKVIITIRTDFESHVARLTTLYPHFERATVRVTPLSAAELRDTIEEPAKLVGLRFEEGLVDLLLQDILGEPAGLPLLQFTLLKLWENRERNRVTLETYRRLGGGRLALARSADLLWEKLIPEEQVTAKRILLQLVRPGEGLEVTSRRISREKLYRVEDKDRINRVLNRLLEERLLRSSKGNGFENQRIEVAHEALVRNWPRLVNWLEKERVALGQRLQLSASAEQWDSRKRDPAFLLRGVLLEEAREYEDLGGLEEEFVRASVAYLRKVEEEKLKARHSILLWTQAVASMSVFVIATLMQLRVPPIYEEPPFQLPLLLIGWLLAALMLMLPLRVIRLADAPSPRLLSVDQAIWLYYWVDLVVLSYLIYHTGGLWASPFSAFLVLLPTNGIILGQDIWRVASYYAFVFIAGLLLVVLHVDCQFAAGGEFWYDAAGAAIVASVFATFLVGYSIVQKQRLLASSHLSS